MASTDVSSLYKQYLADNEVTVLDPATYRLEITSCKGNTEKQQLSPTYKVVDGPLAGRRVLAGLQTLTENSARIFFDLCRRLGIPREYFEQPGGVDFDDLAQRLVGKVFDVEVNQRPYKDEMRNGIVPWTIKLIGTRDKTSGQIVGEGGAPATAPAAATPPPAAAPPAPPAAPPAAPAETQPAAAPPPPPPPPPPAPPAAPEPEQAAPAPPAAPPAPPAPPPAAEPEATGAAAPPPPPPPPAAPVADENGTPANGVQPKKAPF